MSGGFYPGDLCPGGFCPRTVSTDAVLPFYILQFDQKNVDLVFKVLLIKVKSKKRHMVFLLIKFIFKIPKTIFHL